MRMNRVGLALLAMLAVAGCDTNLGRSAGLNAPEDVGALPADYREQAVAFTRAKLNDPKANMTVLAPSSEIAACNVSVIGSHFGWMVPVVYDAPDGCGDCEGHKTIYLWFSHGKIEHMSYFPDQC
ncbi:MAG: hypothetical protein WBG82_02735 [Parvibaculum sp.]|uniref:hypothetical protein n=1 Tax=Parvibaculum sp. TaxID=2024848 RepID=UPI003C74F03C